MSKKKNRNRTASETIPAEFLQRIESIVAPPFLQKVLDSFREDKSVAFRQNHLLSPTTDEFEKQLAELPFDCQPINWFPGSYSVAGCHRESLIGSSLFDTSQIYIQNPSSYLPCLALNPQPGESVLDLAAAPGGKTLLLCTLMKNEGRLAAVEAVRSRFFKLQANLKRYGSKITRTYLADGRSIGRKVPARFDRVLLDAPCSGEARIHQTDPDSWQYWQPRKIREQSRKQYGLIRSAFDSLRPGGEMVYCTCSFAPEENEAIVSDFLNQQPAALLEEIEIPFSGFQPGLSSWNEKEFHAEIEKTVRVIPDSLCDGFYLARIRKQS